MSREPALWRKVFDAVENEVGPRLQAGVHREDFADAIVLAKRTQKAIGRRVEGVTTGVLHVLNIPARQDTRRLARQLTEIERELRTLSQEVRKR